MRRTATVRRFFVAEIIFPAIPSNASKHLPAPVC